MLDAEEFGFKVYDTGTVSHFPYDAPDRHVCSPHWSHSAAEQTRLKGGRTLKDPLGVEKALFLSQLQAGWPCGWWWCISPWALTINFLAPLTMQSLQLSQGLVTGTEQAFLGCRCPQHWGRCGFKTPASAFGFWDNVALLQWHLLQTFGNRVLLESILFSEGLLLLPVRWVTPVSSILLVLQWGATLFGRCYTEIFVNCLIG